MNKIYPYLPYIIIAVGYLIYYTTDNMRVKMFGGEQTVNVEKGKRVVNVTWKDSALWVLTKEDNSTQPQTYSFKEKSNLGQLEGTIFIVEH